MRIQNTRETGNYLVRVRAQVMSRDDSSGGWVPLGGGGLSNVSVRKRPRPAAQPPPPTTAASAGTTITTTANNNNTTTTTQQANAGGGNGNGGNGGGTQTVAVIQPGQNAQTQQQQDQKPKHDYLIFGKRISDDSIVLSCTIKKDFEYNKVMPTFHHWKTGDKKFGLTFQAAADARAFDKGVRTAIEDLLDGFADTSPSSPLPKCPKDVGDDDVFMTLNLPQEPPLGGDSRSSSDSSKHSQDPHRIQHYIPRDKPLEPRQPTYESSKGENYPYVQLQPFHEYIYPVEEQPGLGGNGNGGGGGGGRKLPSTLSRLGGDSPASPKKTFIEMQQQESLSQQQLQLQQPPSMGGGGKPLKKAKQQSVCRYCNQLFTEERNPKGACDYAPDAAQSAIAKISCLWCAQCTFYHCAADAEGDFAQHPCDCASDDSCTRRWCCLALLSMFVPCLWLYPPLKLCHWCGVRCGACGGRHHTM